MNDRGPTAANRSDLPGWLRLSAFFVTVTLILGLYASSDPAIAIQAAFLGLGFHVLFSLYDGRFSRLRTVTWLVFLSCWELTFAIGFLAYVVPRGQMSFWAASKLGPIFGRILFDPAMQWELRLFWSLLVQVAIVSDLVVMYSNEFRGWRRVKWLLVAIGLVIAALTLNDLVRLFIPPQMTGGRQQDSFPIVPAFDHGWMFAILRAIPNKGRGVATLFVVMILPMVWPWVDAGRFHGPATRAPWTIVWLGLCACWVGLITLGVQPPGDTAIIWARGLILYHAAFFIALPIGFRHFLPREGDSRTAVFE